MQKFLIFSFVLLSSAFPADVIWKDSVNGSSWNYGDHWFPSGIPGMADTAVFNTIGNSLSTEFRVSIIAPAIVGSLEFNNANLDAHYLIFGATPLQLNSSLSNSRIHVTSKNHNETILSVPIILGKDLDIINEDQFRILFDKKITGDKNISISGSGAIVFAGTDSNTFSGNTTIKGKLVLNKTNALGTSGNLTLDSGVVEYLQSNQIPTTSTIKLEGQSTLLLGSHSQTVKNVEFTPSTASNRILMENGSLTITDTLSLSDHALISGGTLHLSGGIHFSGRSQNANIYSAIDLGNAARNIAVHSTPRLSLNGPIYNGSIIKTGNGILNITQVASVSGFSIQEGGLHLNGHLVSATPVQISSGAFLYGKGSIDGSLNIQGTMSVGEVYSDSSPSDHTEYFSFDRLISEMHPTELLFLTGDVPHGSISDGIQVSGDITFSPDSTLVIKFSPTMLSNLDIDGKIILDSPNIQLVATEGLYQLNQNYGILYAGSIEGQIGSIASSFAMINPIISYITEDSFSAVAFSLSLNRFSDFFATGNAAPVAAYLDSLIDDPCQNSAIVIEALINTPELDDIEKSLLQMQPSAFTSLTVAQENDLLYIRNSVYSHLQESQKTCFFSDNNSLQLWASLLGGSAYQANQSGEPGYLARSPGVMLGFDGAIGDDGRAGASVGYIYTFHDWKQSRGSANMQNIYGSLYAQSAGNKGFIATYLTGGYTFYDVHRKMTFGPGNVTRTTATSNFGGFEGLFGVKVGGHFPVRAPATITPFASLDYMVVHQNEINEERARSLNLHIENHTGDLLASEAGVELNFCEQKDETTFLKANLRFSAVAESRFFGKTEKGSFDCGGSFHVKGLYPSRVLGSVGIGISASFGTSTFLASYLAKTNWQFTDQFLTFQYLWKF